MAVGTKEPEILEPMIVVEPVDVVEDQRQRPTSPFSDPAFMAAVLDQAALPEAVLHAPQVRVGAVRDEDRFESEARAPRVLLAAKMALPQEMARIKA